MMFWITFLIILVDVAIVSASSVSERVVMEPSISKFTSDAWVQERGISSTDYITCTFMMKLNKYNMDAFESRVMDLSTPDHPTYGGYMTNHQIRAQISPSSAHINTVLAFLDKYEVNQDNNPHGNTVEVNDLRTMIHIRMVGTIAEQMLQTQFVQYRSVTERDVSIFRVSRPYTLPTEISSLVSYVDDIVRYPAVSHPLLTYGHQDSGITDEELATQQAMGKMGYNNENPYLHCGNDCYGYTTPALLRELYGYPNPTADTTDPNYYHEYPGTCIVSFQHRHYDSRNIDKFVDMCGVDGGHINDANTATVGTGAGAAANGVVCGLGGCMETTLQIEYARAVTGGSVPLTVFYNDNYSLARWLSWLINTPTAPLVHILSYVNDDSAQNSPEYLTFINYHFIIAAARGFSILYSSGDEGAWGRSGVMGVNFQPDFPASAPWVTSVGGSNMISTALSNINIGVNEPIQESVWECSGGGFSNVFPAPRYQITCMQEYLGRATYESALPASSRFNATGRGFPDIMAVGGETNPYCVVVRGGKGTIGVSTTAAAVTVVGSMISTLNKARMNAGKAALGFLNPLLYSDAARSCYKDISDGSENHCHIGVDGQGFKAVEGWDAASGFGGLRYDCLQALVL